LQDAQTAINEMNGKDYIVAEISVLRSHAFLFWSA